MQIFSLIYVYIDSIKNHSTSQENRERKNLKVTEEKRDKLIVKETIDNTSRYGIHGKE